MRGPVVSLALCILVKKKTILVSPALCILVNNFQNFSLFSKKKKKKESHAACKFKSKELMRR